MLQDAVKLRLRSDVPLAVSLSGGLDSSTVAALAARQVTDLHGFTFGSPKALQSEGPVVDRFAEEVGITPHYIWPTLDAAAGQITTQIQLRRNVQVRIGARGRVDALSILANGQRLSAEKGRALP